MRTLTEKEFADRVQALQRAKKLFIDTGLTNNITNAFIAYQTIFAEREREIFIHAAIDRDDPEYYISSRYERVKCPDCGTDMKFRLTPDTEYPTQLVCKNPDCDTLFSSKETMEWWMQNLAIKERGINDGKCRPITPRGAKRIQTRRDTRNDRKAARRIMPTLPKRPGSA